jgi:hypothetical protein
LFGALLIHKRLPLTLASLAIAACLVAPWTIRNYIVFHRFMPVANTLGYNLFKGYNPLANGSGHWGDFNHVQLKLLGPEMASVPKTPMWEVDLDDIYRSAAVAFIKAHPFESFIVLPIKKILLFWMFDVYDPGTHQLLFQLAFWPLLFTSTIGIVAAARSRRNLPPDHLTVLIYFAAQTIIMAAYAVHARYKLNADVLLFAYAAFGVMLIAAKLRIVPNPVGSLPSR